MLEMVVWSLFAGSLGFQAIALSAWMRHQHLRMGQQCEEEELLTRYESKDNSTTAGTYDPGFDYGETEELDPEPLNGLNGSHGRNGSNGSNGSNGTGYTQTENKRTAPRDPRLVGWEFKIVRASRDVFRDSRVFQRLCHEEAEAGWILLEKLDDRRVRFKRPIGMREVVKPDLLNHDPYRCHYGAAVAWNAWVGAIATLTAIILPAYLGYTLVSITLSKDSVPHLPAQPLLPSSSSGVPSTH